MAIHVPKPVFSIAIIRMGYCRYSHKPLPMPFPRAIWCIAITVILLASCGKDKNEPEAVVGRFTAHRTCTVTTVPSDLGIDTFYTNYLNCSGIAIVAPVGVAAGALYKADSIIAFMLDGLGPVRDELMRNGVYHVLYPVGMTPNDMPEKQGEPRAYGPASFIPHKQMSITSVANLLCYPAPDNRSGNDCELVHEFGHNLHVHGLSKVYPHFDAELETAYQNALAQSLWDSTYVKADALHYFEEGMQIWYGVNRPGPVGGNGHSNHIGTREQLHSYDATLYGLLDKYLNKREDIPVCFR